MEQPAEELLLDVDNLIIQFGNDPLIQGISFRLSSKERMGIYGGPESGKTSLLMSLCGLKNFYDGNITVLGYSIDDFLQRYKKGIGLVTQGDTLFGRMTLGENMDFIATLHGCKVGKKEHISFRDSLIEKLQMEDLVNIRLMKMNRGQKKRAALICALSYKPKLLLLDEPVQNIDEFSKELILKTIQEYCDEGGGCISFFSDEREMPFYDRIGVIKEKNFSICPPGEYKKLFLGEGEGC